MEVEIENHINYFSTRYHFDRNFLQLFDIDAEYNEDRIICIVFKNLNDHCEKLVQMICQFDDMSHHKFRQLAKSIHSDEMIDEIYEMELMEGGYHHWVTLKEFRKTLAKKYSGSYINALKFRIQNHERDIAKIRAEIDEIENEFGVFK